MTPAPHCTRRALLLFGAGCAVGCNQRAIESWLSQNDGPEMAGSLYGEAQYSRAMAELRRRVPSPIQALSLLVYPDHAVLQAQDPAAPKNVLQYVYRGGAISPPVPVKLLGTGKLEDNLFPLESVKIAVLPTDVADMLSLIQRQTAAAGVACDISGRGALGIVLLRLDGDPPSPPGGFGETGSAHAQIVSDLRREASTRGGSVVVLSAASDVAKDAGRFSPIGDAEPVMRAVKARFDPHHVLNPGLAPWN